MLDLNIWSGPFLIFQGWTSPASRRWRGHGGAFVASFPVAEAGCFCGFSFLSVAFRRQELADTQQHDLLATLACHCKHAEVSYPQPSCSRAPILYLDPQDLDPHIQLDSQAQ